MKPIASFRPRIYAGRVITLYPDRIERHRESHPLTGVTADVISSGGTLTGYRAIAITGPDFAWTKRIDGMWEGIARKFAAAVNLAVRQAATVTP